MPETTGLSSVFVVRYKHNGEVIDVSSRGESGPDAFQHYMDRLKSWGKNPKDYKFVSARRVPSAEDQASR